MGKRRNWQASLVYESCVLAGAPQQLGGPQTGGLGSKLLDLCLDTEICSFA